jgi:hypothetical protein
VGVNGFLVTKQTKTHQNGHLPGANSHLQTPATDPGSLGSKNMGGSEATKGPGSDFFFDIFYGVFEFLLPRNAQKRDKTKPKEIGFWFLSIVL